MGRKATLTFSITLSLCCVSIVTPAIIMVQLIQENPEANFSYAIGNKTEYECCPDAPSLHYASIGGRQGATIAFDDTLVNYLYIKETGEKVPFIGFNLKNVETMRLGGFDSIVIRRDDVAVYAKMEYL